MTLRPLDLGIRRITQIARDQGRNRCASRGRSDCTLLSTLQYTATTNFALQLPAPPASLLACVDCYRGSQGRIEAECARWPAGIYCD